MDGLDIHRRGLKKPPLLANSDISNLENRAIKYTQFTKTRRKLGNKSEISDVNKLRAKTGWFRPHQPVNRLCAGISHGVSKAAWHRAHCWIRTPPVEMLLLILLLPCLVHCQGELRNMCALCPWMIYETLCSLCLLHEYFVQSLKCLSTFLLLILIG